MVVGAILASLRVVLGIVCGFFPVHYLNFVLCLCVIVFLNPMVIRFYLVLQIIWTFVVETLSIIILFPYILISFLFSGFETVTYMLEVHMVTFNLKLNCACCLRPKPIYLFMDSREASLTKILLGTRVQ